MLRFVRTGLVIALVSLPAVTMTARASVAAPAGSTAAPLFPRLQSLYVPMPDGVRLAVDVWLPPGTAAGARLPTVLETDRYWRAKAYSGGIGNNSNYDIAEPWNQRGYAYVFADLRGTGASFGTLTAELGGQMIADAGSLADWIAARPWSNGRVGVIGVSYSGDTAMLSLAQRNHHITAAPFPLGKPKRITFDLLPTSVLFHAGDRIRIAIAAADPVSFQLMPANGTASYRIGHRGTSSSFVELPVVR